MFEPRVFFQLFACVVLSITVYHFSWTGINSKPPYAVRYNFNYFHTRQINETAELVKADNAAFKASELLYRAYMGHIPNKKLASKFDATKKFNFIIAGVMKCGTSALRDFLASHPQIKFANLYANEGHYFDIGCLGRNESSCLSIENMARFKYGPQPYPNPNFDQIMQYAETTPAYFTTPGLPRLLKMYNDRLKIVIVTCEPAARALSDYRHRLNALSKLSTTPETLSPISFDLGGHESFDEVVTASIRQLRNRTDDELIKMVADYRQVEDAFWSGMNSDNANYTIDELTAMRKSSFAKLPFSPSIKIVLDGLYDIHLASYLDQFNSSVKLIDNTNLRNDPYRTLIELEQFLEVEGYFESNMFVKPSDNPFFCTNTTLMAQRRLDFFRNLLHQNTKQYRLKPFEGLTCKSDNPNKSRSMQSTPSPAELRALDKLREFYAPMRHRLQFIANKTLDWD